MSTEKELVSLTENYKRRLQAQTSKKHTFLHYEGNGIDAGFYMRFDFSRFVEVSDDNILHRLMFEIQQELTKRSGVKRAA